MEYVVARIEAWHGHTWITKGELWAADDPLVREHPTWFSDDLESVAKRTVPAREEKTTAVPKGAQTRAAK